MPLSIWDLSNDGVVRDPAGQESCYCLSSTSLSPTPSHLSHSRHSVTECRHTLTREQLKSLVGPGVQVYCVAAEGTFKVLYENYGKL